MWTTRLLTKQVREKRPAAGHGCLADLAQGTLRKISAADDIKPHEVRYYPERRVRYYPERRDDEFPRKMADAQCVNGHAETGDCSTVPLS